MGDVDISTLSIQDIDQYFIKRSKEIKTATYNTERSTIRNFCKFVQKYLQIEMCFDYTLIREARCPLKQIRTFTPGQLKEVIDSARYEQDKLMIAVLYEAGLRISELVYLQVEDIQDTRLQVRGKGGTVRLTFVTQDLARRLRNHLMENNIYAGPVFRHIQKHSNVLTDHFQVDTVRQRLKRIFKKAGYEMFPHQIRHTFATELLSNGADVRSVQKLLGHANLNTTMRYLQVTDNHLEATFKKHLVSVV
jgi:site-specific recombinase XerD